MCEHSSWGSCRSTDSDSLRPGEGPEILRVQQAHGWCCSRDHTWRSKVLCFTPFQDRTFLPLEVLLHLSLTLNTSHLERTVNPCFLSWLSVSQPGFFSQLSAEALLAKDVVGPLPSYPASTVSSYLTLGPLRHVANHPPSLENDPLTSPLSCVLWAVVTYATPTSTMRPLQNQDLYCCLSLGHPCSKVSASQTYGI